MKASTKTSYLLFFTGLSIILSVGAVFTVWSGLVDSLSEFKGLYLIAGILLLYMSLFFCIKAYIDRETTFKGRLLFLFGPGISGGFAGLAGISYGLYPGAVPESFWWTPLLFVLLSFVSFQVAVVLAILLLRKDWGRYRTGSFRSPS